MNDIIVLMRVFPSSFVIFAEYVPLMAYSRNRVILSHCIFCRQVSVKIVLFVIGNNRIYLSIGLFCRFGSAIKRTK